MTLKARDLVDALLGRFVPATATMMALVATLIVLENPRGFSSAALFIASIELVTMTLGYAATTLGLRRGREGRVAGGLRHTAAGVVATLLLGAASGFYQGVNLPGVAVLGFAAGAITGVLFAARSFLRPKPPKRSLDELEVAADTALEQAGVRLLPTGEIVPLRSPESQPERRAQVA